MKLNRAQEMHAETAGEARAGGSHYRAATTMWGEVNMRESFWMLLRREAKVTWVACGAFEWLAFSYFALSSVPIILFAEHLQHPWRMLAWRAAVVCVVLLLCRIQARWAEISRTRGPSFISGWWHFWRHWYPHLFFLY